MNSNFAKGAIVVAAAAAAIILFVVLGSDDDSDETTATTAAQTTTAADEATEEKPEKQKKPAEAVPRITIAGGEPQGGVADLEFSAGDEVRFEVVSDVAEEVHVHGYDVTADLEPGKPAVVSFPADIEGVFEVELELSHVQIAELTVNPG